MKAIYKVTNKINGKCYIGQSNNPKHRWIEHKCDATNGYDKGKSPFHDAIRCYGAENFEFSILGWYRDYNEKEKFFIRECNSIIPNGYNILEGGNEPPHKFGEDHHNSVYSQDLVDQIIDALLSKKYTQKNIQDIFCVPQNLVSSINLGITHRRMGISYPIIKTSNYFCDEDTFQKICYLLKNSSCTCAEIGAYFGFDTSCIKAINSGRNHYSDSITYPIRNFRGKANSQSVEAILAKRSTETIDTSLEM